MSTPNGPASQTSRTLAKPIVPMLFNEFRIVKLRISGEHPVDLLALAGRHPLRWIEAPDTGHQSLPPEHLVNAGYAAGEPVCRIENGRVRVRNLHSFHERFERK